MHDREGACMTERACGHRSWRGSVVASASVGSHCSHNERARAASRLTCLGGDDVVTDRELGDGAVLSFLRHEDVVLVAPASPLSAIFSGPIDAG